MLLYTFHFQFGLFFYSKQTHNLIWEHSTTRRCGKQYSDLHSIIAIVWVLFKTTLRKPHHPAKIFEIFNKLCETDINRNLLQTSIVNFFSLIQYCYNLIISRIHSLSNPTENIQNIVISFKIIREVWNFHIVFTFEDHENLNNITKLVDNYIVYWKIVSVNHFTNKITN